MDDAAANLAVDAETCDRSEDGISENHDHPSTEDSGDGVGIFCCRDGGAAFKEEAAFSEHRLLQPLQHTYLHGCSDASPNEEKDSEAPYLCTLCSLSFNERNELHLHMKNHDSISPNNPGPTKQQTYECPECGKSYAVIGHFLNHLRSHKPPSKSLFHDLEHLKKKSFQCEFCGRNYSRASALDAHRRCHEGKLVKSKNKSPGDAVQTGESAVETKPSENHAGDDSEKCFKCMCGKAFSTVSRLKTHQRFSRNGQCSPGETKPKPKKNCGEFYCSECSKGFTSHIALFNHQRWHMNHSHGSAERFPCEECGKVFTTLTFYYKHQRTAHSNETPAKSFLHQVCQVQKKAFECKDCGLKFSRASALHSHQLQHTDAFRQTERGDQMSSPLLPVDKTPESGFTEAEHSQDSPEGKVQSESFPATHMEEEVHINEPDKGMECYEPGDFNVQVISASESEDEATQDPNPDLELLCESDQDVRDDTDVMKPEMDLKIVQIDFEQTDEQSEVLENEATGERLDCPECYRWFTNPTSLRVHRMWHGVRKRRQQAQGQSVAVYACETGSNEAQFNHSDQTPSNNLLNQAERTFTCNESGDVFSHLSALVPHQLHHPQRKPFQCPDCMMSYLHASSLFNHMKTCSAQKRESLSVSKKEYNPKKTLLGPKIFHCEQCGKGFWSLGAYSHHKQNQTECVNLRLRKGLLGSLHSANGRTRSGLKVACPVCGRKFRHKGIMALHMRKHENGNHKCELCSRSFRLFSSLLRHQVVHSSQLLPPPIKSFQHQLEQLKKNTYSCPDCGKLFSRAKALQFHMKSHGYESGSSPSSPQAAAKAKDLQCPTCFGHFNNKVFLKAHQKLCMKRDDKISVKTEPSDGDVKMHKDAKTRELLDLEREKTDVKKTGDTAAQKIVKHRNVEELKNQDAASQRYKCSKCDRSFPVVGALNFHKRIHVEDDKSVTESHTGLSLFKKPSQEEPGKGLIHCSDCGRRFMTKSALGSHRRWHKEKKSSQPSLEEEDSKSTGLRTEDGPFQCGKCQKHFFNHRVLQRHQIFNPLCQSKTESDSNWGAGMNLTPQRFPCPLCGEMFEQVLLLASHFKHCKNLKVYEYQGEPRRIPGHGGVNHIRNQCLLSSIKPKAHQCSVCSMTFAKARGLRAHKWQAHSKSRNRLPTSVKTEPSDSSSEVTEPEPQLLTFTSCPDRGKQLSSAVCLLEHKRVCLEVKQESKRATQTPESAAEIPPPPSRLSEHAAKCFFKCDKCGKAFQTEEQLGSHKNKAKSRPHCCALCCHGFWTENQLQQHLAWHDEVRCRLPNEMRFRLSAAMTSKPFKPDCPVTSFEVNPPLHPSSQTQTRDSSITCNDCGLRFTHSDAFETHLHQHALEEEVAQLEGGRPSSGHLSSGETPDENTSSSARTQAPELTQAGPTAQVQNGFRGPHTCTVCGKKYSYLVSFNKHLKLHKDLLPEDENQRENRPPARDPALRKYECPDCGMSFIRRTRLISHLRVHKSRRLRDSVLPKCDQCNKQFSTIKSWLAHCELHSLMQFWCLSCARGFPDEMALDKHLQKHNLRQNNHIAIDQNSQLAEEPTSKPNARTKTLMCKHCGKAFIHHRKLCAHYLKHFRERARSASHFKNTQLASEKRVMEVNANTEELPEDACTREDESSLVSRDPQNSEDSDCGEPHHCVTLPKPSSCADPSSGPLQAGQAGRELEIRESNIHREHKYWDWECIECDMGFDEMAKLHLHYIKHATGEVPIPQGDSQG